MKVYLMTTGLDRMEVVEGPNASKLGIEVNVAEETAARWKKAIADYDQAQKEIEAEMDPVGRQEDAQGTMVKAFRR